MLRGRKEHVCGDECTESESELSVWLEWSSQMLEHYILWDNRGVADTEAEAREEVPREKIG